MTSISPPEFYPQYCFHLSPTINRWCHLRSSDIARLTSHPGFEGQDLFFHTNHPIKWVRIAGVIVAIDEHAGRRIYTVDDSSGFNTECMTTIPKDAQKPTTQAAAAASTTPSVPDPPTQSQIPPGLDVGQVVDVKGGLSVFRGQKQINVEKIVVLRSTAEEVSFWAKITALRETVLSKPWILDRHEVRRFRKEAEGEERRSHDRKKSKPKKASSATESATIGGASSRRLDKHGHRNARTTAAAATTAPTARRRPTGLEKRQRAPKGGHPVYIEGKYSALGL